MQHKTGQAGWCTLDAPLSTMLQALGLSQSTTNVKNSSPIFCTSKSPARVPMSDALISAATHHTYTMAYTKKGVKHCIISTVPKPCSCVCSNVGVQHQRHHQPSCVDMLGHCSGYGFQVEAASTVLHTLCPVDNGGSTGSGDSVVVSFPEPSDSADACFGEEMHGKVTQAFLGDHHIRLVLDDLCADLLDVLFLHLQQRSPANGHKSRQCIVSIHILPLKHVIGCIKIKHGCSCIGQGSHVHHRTLGKSSYALQ